jgi:hypothetical protein
VPIWCHWWMVSSGTLSSAATSSVVKRSDSAPASSPDSGTSAGAIAAGGQFGSGQDHSTGIRRSYWSAGALCLYGLEWRNRENARVVASGRSSVSSNTLTLALRFLHCGHFWICPVSKDSSSVEYLNPTLRNGLGPPTHHAFVIKSPVMLPAAWLSAPSARQTWAKNAIAAVSALLGDGRPRLRMSSFGSILIRPRDDHRDGL